MFSRDLRYNMACSLVLNLGTWMSLSPLIIFTINIIVRDN